MSGWFLILFIWSFLTIIFLKPLFFIMSSIKDRIASLYKQANIVDKDNSIQSKTPNSVSVVKVTTAPTSANINITQLNDNNLKTNLTVWHNDTDLVSECLSYCESIEIIQLLSTNKTWAKAGKSQQAWATTAFKSDKEWGFALDSYNDWSNKDGKNIELTVERFPYLGSLRIIKGEGWTDAEWQNVNKFQHLTRLYLGTYSPVLASNKKGSPHNSVSIPYQNLFITPALQAILKQPHLRALSLNCFNHEALKLITSSLTYLREIQLGTDEIFCTEWDEIEKLTELNKKTIEILAAVNQINKLSIMLPQAWFAEEDYCWYQLKNEDLTSILNKTSSPLVSFKLVSKKSPQLDSSLFELFSKESCTCKKSLRLLHCQLNEFKQENFVNLHSLVNLESLSLGFENKDFNFATSGLLSQTPFIHQLREFQWLREGENIKKLDDLGQSNPDWTMAQLLTSDSIIDDIVNALLTKYGKPKPSRLVSLSILDSGLTNAAFKKIGENYTVFPDLRVLHFNVHCGVSEKEIDFKPLNPVKLTSVRYSYLDGSGGSCSESCQEGLTWTDPSEEDLEKAKEHERIEEEISELMTPYDEEWKTTDTDFKITLINKDLENTEEENEPFLLDVNPDVPLCYLKIRLAQEKGYPIYYIIIYDLEGNEVMENGKKLSELNITAITPIRFSIDYSR